MIIYVENGTAVIGSSEYSLNRGIEGVTSTKSPIIHISVEYTLRSEIGASINAAFKEFVDSGYSSEVKTIVFPNSDPWFIISFLSAWRETFFASDPKLVWLLNSRPKFPRGEINPVDFDYTENLFNTVVHRMDHIFVDTHSLVQEICAAYPNLKADVKCIPLPLSLAGRRAELCGSDIAEKEVYALGERAPEELVLAWLDPLTASCGYEAFLGLIDGLNRLFEEKYKQHKLAEMLNAGAEGAAEQDYSKEDLDEELLVLPWCRVKAVVLSTYAGKGTVLPGGKGGYSANMVVDIDCLEDYFLLIDSVDGVISFSDDEATNVNSLHAALSPKLPAFIVSPTKHNAEKFYPLNMAPKGFVETGDLSVHTLTFNPQVAISFARDVVQKLLLQKQQAERGVSIASRSVSRMRQRYFSRVSSADWHLACALSDVEDEEE